FPMYYMSMPREYERIQRRSFVRYSVLLPAQFRLYQDKSWQKGFLVDISGGGARLSHREKLNAGDLVQVSFSLKQHEPNLVIIGKVVRSEAFQGQGSAMYHSGVEFKDISVGVQDRIVGFIFQRMLEQRRLQEW
ncbi:MAG: PilZ domain-containing protein, partial [Bacillota bacterium]|nr:PilZ domain-containing protein [Bacillota bacterium]